MQVGSLEGRRLEGDEGRKEGRKEGEEGWVEMYGG
jgi:hypothetical protein